MKKLPSKLSFRSESFKKLEFLVPTVIISVARHLYIGRENEMLAQHIIYLNHDKMPLHCYSCFTLIVISGGYPNKFWTRPLPPQSNFFVDFHAAFGKFWRKNRLVYPIWCWHSLEILDSPSPVMYTLELIRCSSAECRVTLINWHWFGVFDFKHQL